MGSRIAVTVALAAAVVATAVALVPVAGAYHEPVEYFRLRDPQIGESSGVASSSRRDGLFFTHNDSGDDARVLGPR